MLTCVNDSTTPPPRLRRRTLPLVAFRVPPRVSPSAVVREAGVVDLDVYRRRDAATDAGTEASS